MAPSKKALEKYLDEATRQLYAEDPNTVTVNSVRQRAEEQNKLGKGFFVTSAWKARSKTLITGLVQTLLANGPPSSIPQPDVEHETKSGVKRSSSDESSPVAKRQKKGTTAVQFEKPNSKREASSSALSELSDSVVEPKNEKKTVEKAAVRKQESDSELSDLDISEDEPKQKKGTKKSARARKSKEETESELSELESSEEEPKPIRNARRKSTKQADSDDDEKPGDPEASSYGSKRKQATPIAKRNTKRAKVESESEDELATETKPTNDETDADVKADGDAPAGLEIKVKPIETVKLDSGGDAEQEKQGTKPSVADDSDSSLSSVLDEPPVRKRKSKNIKGASKSKATAPKEVTGDDAEIKKLQGQLVKCGVRKIWGIELKKYGNDSRARIRHLRDMLRDIGMDGRFSEAKAKEIKERRELMGELEAVNEMNELWGREGREGRGGRASRSKAVRKSLKEESDDSEDEDEVKAKEEGEDKGPEAKTNPRVSKRMADLAFLGSESESD
ncbi:hypothetical protein F5Y19DRAFT_422349 [Xylariaceae sp. FL1651]|nr:hypothetical protein F5Y19DRAFT_422349 [Xylariaceae sp. FL1651]